MKILLFGSTGQVGYELQKSLQPLGKLIFLDRNIVNLVPRVWLFHQVKISLMSVNINFIKIIQFKIVKNKLD